MIRHYYLDSPHLAGKQRDSTFSWSEQGKHLGDEGTIRFLFKVSLKADPRALSLGRHMYCKVGITLMSVHACMCVCVCVCVSE